LRVTQNSVDLYSITTGVSTPAEVAVLLTTLTGDTWIVVSSVSGGNVWTVTSATNVYTFFQIYALEAIASGTVQNLYDIIFDDINTGFICGQNGTVLKTKDSGVSWSSIGFSSATELRGIASAGASYTYIYVCGDGGMIRKADKRANWGILTSGTVQNLRSISFCSDDDGIVCGTNAVIRYTINGSDWLTPDSIPDGVVFNVIKYFSRSFALVGSTDSLNNVGVLLKSTNRGRDWSVITLPSIFPVIDIYIASNTVAYVAVSSTDGLEAYIYKTVDSGSNWTVLFTAPNIVKFANIYSDANIYFIGGKNLYYYNGSNIYQIGADDAGRNELYFINLKLGFTIDDNGLIKKYE
jgi:photosystem II stability/assembly factor-like uncharacterized protein